MTIWFGFAFLLSFLSTLLLGRLAVRWNFLDRPIHPRKIHIVPKPLLGGLAIFFTIACSVLILLGGSSLTGGEITVRHYLGFLLGGLILMVGGVLDDRFNLPPRLSIVAPILAAITVIAFGIGVEKLTNPFGGVIVLLPWQSNLIVFVWLMVVMYTTKFLDGLDGLATSVSAIGALMILLLSLSIAYYQPDVALLSTIALGALLGFLAWNFHPAAVFLGEGGSTFVGYLLGVLAVISGGKLATALLVLGIPLLDVVWVVVRRFREGGWRRVFQADRRHLHHRLLDRGWGQKRIVLSYMFIATAFGLAALFLQSRDKLIAFVVLTVMMLIAAIFLASRDHPHVPLASH